MLKIFLIFLLGLTPWLISFWFMHKAEVRARRRLRAVSRLSYRTRRGASTPPELQYIKGVGYVIGDISCRYNARSPEIRCAVNPYGPCKHCREYEEIDNGESC